MAGDSPGTLDDAFASARKSGALLTELGQLGEKGELRTIDSRERLKVCYESARWGHIRVRFPDLKIGKRRQKLMRVCPCGKDGISQTRYSGNSVFCVWTG